MEQYEKVMLTLNDLDITYDIISHPPALTTEEADFFIQGMEGVRTKTMFLTNKKKTSFYLLIMDDKKRLDMDSFKDIVQANRIKMSSSDTLFEKMSLPPGVVSPFGLLNNKDKDIQIFMDEAIKDEEIMTFHPNTNERTIFIKTTDLLRFLESIGYKVKFINLP